MPHFTFRKRSLRVSLTQCKMSQISVVEAHSLAFLGGAEKAGGGRRRKRRGWHKRCTNLLLWHARTQSLEYCTDLLKFARICSRPKKIVWWHMRGWRACPSLVAPSATLHWLAGLCHCRRHGIIQFRCMNFEHSRDYSLHWNLISPLLPKHFLWCFCLCEGAKDPKIMKTEAGVDCFICIDYYVNFHGFDLRLPRFTRFSHFQTQLFSWFGIGWWWLGGHSEGGACELCRDTKNF